MTGLFARAPSRLAKAARSLWRSLRTHTGAGRDAFPVAARQMISDAQQKADLAEGRLRAAIEAMPEGVVFLDEEGRYILWNRRYAEIYHRSADLFAPGRRLSDTLRIGVARGDYPEAVGREDEWIAARLALLDNPISRHEQRLADGRWIMIEERKTADGGTIGIRIDITEMKQQADAMRRALAQAEAANRAKTEFLANMSHEVRTPLNGVVGMAHVLAQTQLTASQRRLTDIIISSAAELEHLLTGVLDLSRIEAGRLDVHNAPFDLRRMVDTAAAPYALAARQKGLQFEVEVEPGLAHEVVGDAARLTQILGAILSNAVKFTAHGGVALRVFAAGGHGGCVFQVNDTGIGFEPAEGERLFGRFVQADGGATRQYGGSGLGLAICRELVEMMAGKVEAFGRPGCGATFQVSLDLPPAVTSSLLAGAA